MTHIERDPVLGADLWCCLETSIEHHDGSTECLSGEACELPHALHDWLATCAVLDPPCRCGDPISVPRSAVVSDLVLSSRAPIRPVAA
jgi:hypothetical protein